MFMADASRTIEGAGKEVADFQSRQMNIAVYLFTVPERVFDAVSSRLIAAISDEISCVAGRLFERV